MGMVKILVVEDDPIIAQDLAQQLSERGYAVVGPLDSGEEAILELDQQQPDMALLDIQLMGDLTGIDVARHIQKSRPIPLIYLTNLYDPVTVNKAKSTGPETYLTKPFNPKDLFIAIELAFFRQENRSQLMEQIKIQQYVYVQDNDRFEKVEIKDLLYLKASRSYVEIHASKRKYVRSVPLKDFLPLLPQPPFQRVHKSYAVNVEHIESFQGNRIFISGTEIPLGETYKAAFRKQFRFV